MDRALLNRFPELGASVPWESLGEFPTSVTNAKNAQLPNCWIKRDDLSSSLYGGNKVRTLEVLFADAKAKGAKFIYSTGAYGSNHALASQIHAPRVGLIPRAILFPQPRSDCAKANLRCTSGLASETKFITHWSTLPLAMAAVKLRHRGKAYVMPPGGATPLGVLAYVSAGLELAEQIHRKLLPLPKKIFLGVGSTCTSAGLLLGLRMAYRAGLISSMPHLVSVRVSPWPVTSAVRVAHLSAKASALLEQLLPKEEAFSRADLARNLTVTGRFLGRGYGHATASGKAAVDRLRDIDLKLDTTYSGKAAAAMLHATNTTEEPLLLWATKSSSALPEPSQGTLPGRPQRWLRYDI